MIIDTDTREQIQILLRELQGEGKIHVKGRAQAARWYPGSLASDGTREIASEE